MTEYAPNPRLGDVVRHGDVPQLHPNVMLLPLHDEDNFPATEVRQARDVADTDMRGGLGRYLVVFVPDDREE